MRYALEEKSGEHKIQIGEFRGNKNFSLKPSWKLLEIKVSKGKMNKALPRTVCT